MKYFRNTLTGKVHAFDDDAPSHFITGDFEPMTEIEVQQYIASATSPSLTAADLERQWRDAELTALVWLRDRHRDQLEIGVTTTLTAEQFSELLVFMQALRDWPQSEAFPDASARPVAPAFLEQVRIEQ